MDHASDAMFVSDLQGCLVDCNRMACLSTGYTRAELLTMNVDDIDPEFVRQKHREKLWRKMVPGNPVTLESMHCRKDGTCFPVEVRVVKLEMEENQLILGLVRDVTERRQAGAALWESEALYRASYESAPHGILVYDASGRTLIFNTCLEKITGYQHAEIPGGEIWLLKLYPDEAYRNSIRKDLDDIQPEDAVRKKEAIITAKSGEKRICQFVSRLLPTGIRTVIALSDLPPGNYLRLRVSDTGYGMSLETMSKVFDPYFMTEEKGKGTGLGLAVVQGIVAEWGGDINVDSQLGVGTTVDVYLPLVAKSTEDQPTVEPALATGSERILFVDDEPPLGNIARQMLEKLGYAVTIRTSSLEALELFKAKPGAFDLVITDMTMPHMAGDKLARKLLSIRPDLPVILCTGFSENISPEHTEVLGVKAILMKPLDRAALADSIRQALGSSASQK